MFDQITCVFGLYIWCAGADPADSGVFKSKKYLKNTAKPDKLKDSKLGGESASQMHDTMDGKSPGKDGMSVNTVSKDLMSECDKNTSRPHSSCWLSVLAPCAYVCSCCMSSEEHSEQQMSEDGMFYCSLCEVEVCVSL